MVTKILLYSLAALVCSTCQSKGPYYNSESKEQHSYCFIKFNDEGFWELIIVRKDRRIANRVASGGNLSVLQNKIYFVEATGHLSIFSNDGRELSRVPLSLHGRQASEFSIARSKTGSLMLFDRTHFTLHELNVVNGELKELPQTTSLKMAFDLGRNFADRSYYSGIAFSKDNQMAIAVPTDRRLFESSGDHATSIMVQQSGKILTKVDDGVPLDWIGQQSLLVLSWNKALMASTVKIVGLDGKLVWERRHATGGAVGQNVLAIFEKGADVRSKILIYDLPRLETVQEIDIGPGASLRSEEFAFL